MLDMVSSLPLISKLMSDISLAGSLTSKRTTQKALQIGVSTISNTTTAITWDDLAHQNFLSIDIKSCGMRSMPLDGLCYTVSAIGARTARTTPIL